MLRRGIPFGPPFTPETASIERGLLFLAFMTSIDGQFKVLNTAWMNSPHAPPPAEGHDLLVGQDVSGRFGHIRGQGGDAKLETLAQWVIPTGGAFLFAPSLSLLRNL
jgi:deferrochelatase/peroxidase EfeB